MVPHFLRDVQRSLVLFVSRRGIRAGSQKQLHRFRSVVSRGKMQRRFAVNSCPVDTAARHVLYQEVHNVQTAAHLA